MQIGFFEDGVVDITIFHDGVESRGTMYYQNGNVKYESMYKDGMPDGVFRSYYESGALKFEGSKDYSGNNIGLNGELIGYFDEPGVVKGQRFLYAKFKNDKLQDTLTIYDKSGATLAFVSADSNSRITGGECVNSGKKLNDDELSAISRTLHRYQSIYDELVELCK